jgi:hypothetical protein
MRRRGELMLLVAEALRTGRQQLVAADFFPKGHVSTDAFTHAAKDAGMVQDPISRRWIPGPKTYAFLERYIEQRIANQTTRRHRAA